MDNLNLPLSPTILGMNYLGNVVFAVSGALTAGRHKMDIVGYVLIGTITGIGAKRKATPQDGFGNDFGNGDVVLPPTLVIPIDLAEEVAPKLMNVY